MNRKSPQRTGSIKKNDSIQPNSLPPVPGSSLPPEDNSLPPPNQIPPPLSSSPPLIPTSSSVVVLPTTEPPVQNIHGTVGEIGLRKRVLSSVDKRKSLDVGLLLKRDNKDKDKKKKKPVSSGSRVGKPEYFEQILNLWSDNKKNQPCEEEEEKDDTEEILESQREQIENSMKLWTDTLSKIKDQKNKRKTIQFESLQLGSLPPPSSGSSTEELPILSLDDTNLSQSAKSVMTKLQDSPLSSSRLFEFLISDLSCDSFISSFLLKCHKVANVSSLFDFVMRSYDQAHLTKPETTKRIVRFLRRWFEFHPTDFDLESQWCDTFFLWSSKHNNPELQTLISDIRLKSSSSKNKLSEEYLPPLSKSYPIRGTIGTQIQNSKSGFLTTPIHVIAEYVTSVKFRYLNSLSFSEFLEQRWISKPDRSPNVSNLIVEFNMRALWVASLIVKEPVLKARVLLIERFIQLGDEYVRLRNFAGLAEVVVGLSCSAVDRLKKTWAEVSSERMETFEKLTTLISPHQNSKKYRMTLKSCERPCVPHLAVHLQDLIFIDEGNPDFLENGALNFEKNELLIASIESLLSCGKGIHDSTTKRQQEQSGSYLKSRSSSFARSSGSQIRSNPNLKLSEPIEISQTPILDEDLPKWLERVPYYEEKELYEYSNLVEPRDESKNYESILKRNLSLSLQVEELSSQMQEIQNEFRQLGRVTRTLHLELVRLKKTMNDNNSSDQDKSRTSPSQRRPSGNFSTIEEEEEPEKASRRRSRTSASPMRNNNNNNNHHQHQSPNHEILNPPPLRLRGRES